MNQLQWFQQVGQQEEYEYLMRKEVEEVRKGDFQEFVAQHEADNERHNECAKAPF